MTLSFPLRVSLWFLGSLLFSLLMGDPAPTAIGKALVVSALIAAIVFILDPETAERR